MNCKQIEKRLPLYISDDLNSSQTELIRRHLEQCENCLIIWDELEEARSWLLTSTSQNFDEVEMARMRRDVLVNISKNATPSQLTSFIWLRYPRLTMTAILAGCVCIGAFLFYNNRHDSFTVQKSVNKREAITRSESNKPAHFSEVKLNSRKQNPFKVSHRNSDIPVQLPALERVDTSIFVSVQYQLTSIVPVFDEQQIFDPVITTISTEKMMRIDFQTSDPTIRIIWFVAPNESSTK